MTLNPCLVAEGTTRSIHMLSKVEWIRKRMEDKIKCTRASEWACIYLGNDPVCRRCLEDNYEAYTKDCEGAADDGR
jgi:hypothetical protein